MEQSVKLEALTTQTGVCAGLAPENHPFYRGHAARGCPCSVPVTSWSLQHQHRAQTSPRALPDAGSPLPTQKAPPPVCSGQGLRARVQGGYSGPSDPGVRPVCEHQHRSLGRRPG